MRSRSRSRRCRHTPNGRKCLGIVIGVVARRQWERGAQRRCCERVDLVFAILLGQHSCTVLRHDRRRNRDVHRLRRGHRHDNFDRERIVRSGATEHHHHRDISSATAAVRRLPPVLRRDALADVHELREQAWVLLTPRRRLRMPLECFGSSSRASLSQFIRNSARRRSSSTSQRSRCVDQHL
jgi:hypothetical protein